MIPVIETRRLVLPPLSLDDATQIQKVFPDWRVVEFLGPGVPWPYPDDGAESFIRNVVLPGRQNSTAWHWSMRLNNTPDELIGVINLNEKEDMNRGFWLRPELWGQLQRIQSLPPRPVLSFMH
jgi:[ribosomal protein S5]-alanine N-acetyltransferase